LRWISTTKSYCCCLVPAPPKAVLAVFKAGLTEVQLVPSYSSVAPKIPVPLSPPKAKAAV
jgi:hypothetical protein